MTANQRSVHSPNVYNACRIQAAGFLSVLLLTAPLWLSVRGVPLAPLQSFFTPFLRPFDQIFFGILLLCISSTLIIPTFVASATIILQLIFLVLQDQNRIHPWVLQFGLMYLVLAHYCTEKPGASRDQKALNLLRFIVVLVYLWSGVLKINPNFKSTVLPWLLEPFVAFKLQAQLGLGWLAYSIPGIEIALAIGLLFARSRQVAVVGIIAMHIFIIILLSPIMLNQNHSVLPWNISMILLVLYLFWRRDFSATEVIGLTEDRARRVVTFLAGLMPAFGYAGLWDSYLSFGMYSGNVTTAHVFLQRDEIGKLPDHLVKVATLISGDPALYQIDLYDWNTSELKSPPNPEYRVLRAQAELLCQFDIPPGALYVMVSKRKRLFEAAGDTEVLECEEGELVTVETLGESLMDGERS